MQCRAVGELGLGRGSAAGLFPGVPEHSEDLGVMPSGELAWACDGACHLRQPEPHAPPGQGHDPPGDPWASHAASYIHKDDLVPGS